MGLGLGLAFGELSSRCRRARLVCHCFQPTNTRTCRNPSGRAPPFAGTQIKDGSKGCQIRRRHGAHSLHYTMCWPATRPRGGNCSGKGKGGRRGVGGGVRGEEGGSVLLNLCLCLSSNVTLPSLPTPSHGDITTARSDAFLVHPGQHMLQVQHSTQHAQFPTSFARACPPSQCCSAERRGEEWRGGSMLGQLSRAMGGLASRHQVIVELSSWEGKALVSEGKGRGRGRGREREMSGTTCRWAGLFLPLRSSLGLSIRLPHGGAKDHFHMSRAGVVMGMHASFCCFCFCCFCCYCCCLPLDEW